MKLALLFNHHFDIRYMLTPFSTTVWEIKGKNVRMYNIFGIRIARIHLI